MRQQEGFFQQIADALNNNSALRVVFIIREDYVARLEPFEEILPDELRPRFRLEPLRKSGALLAVRGPLEFLDVNVAELEDEIHKIIENLLKIQVQIFSDGTTKVVGMDGEFVEPIHLQLVCQRWWQDRQQISSKNRDHLISLSDVDEALEDYYVNSIREASKTTKVSEREIRDWCEKKLITSAGTRGIVYQGENDTEGISNKVVAILDRRYLIRPELRSGTKWYELTHDRLIKPIKDSNKKWYEQRRKSRNSLLLKLILPASIVGVIGICLLAFYVYTHYVTVPSLIESGNLLVKSGNYAAAKEYFDRALSIEPKNPWALTGEVVALTGAGKDKNYNFYPSIAIKKFDEALIIALNVEALTGKANALLLLDNASEAEKYFDEALAIDANNKDALTGKANALLYMDGLNNTSEAEKILSKRVLKIDPYNVDALASLYNIAYWSKNNPYPSIWKALALSHISKKVLMVLGHTGVSEEVQRQYYNIAISNNSRDVDALTAIGNTYNAEGNSTEAIKYFDRALKVDPNNKSAFEGKGSALRNLSYNNYTGEKEAIKYYEKAIKVDPTYPRAMTDEGDLLYRYFHNDTGALQLYKRDLFTDPNDTFALNGIGDILSKEGNYKGAILYYDKTLAIEPNNKRALHGIGDVYSKEGNFTGAKKYL